MDDSYTLVVASIIKEQEKIVGPLAWSEAEKVSGLSLENHKVAISGDGKKVVEKLVSQYEMLFGQASIEVCKGAVRPLRSKLKGVEMPQILL